MNLINMEHTHSALNKILLSSFILYEIHNCLMPLAHWAFCFVFICLFFALLLTFCVAAGRLTARCWDFIMFTTKQKLLFQTACEQTYFECSIVLKDYLLWLFSLFTENPIFLGSALSVSAILTASTCAHSGYWNSFF